MPLYKRHFWVCTEIFRMSARPAIYLLSSVTGISKHRKYKRITSERKRITNNIEMEEDPEMITPPKGRARNVVNYFDDHDQISDDDYREESEKNQRT